MKPANIFICRHGESEGNVDKAVYAVTPDYALKLTPKGITQAKELGITLGNRIGDSSIQFYVSPFWRTRQTYVGIRESFIHDLKYKYYEDPRIREQEWGQDMESRDGYKDKVEEYRDSYGHFYYRFRDGGESCADVYDRVSDFLGTLHRDFEKKDFPENCVIVTHGMTMRLMIMRWFHVSVEEFESWSNPKNCDYFHLNLNGNKYELITPLRKHTVRHTYQYPFGENKKLFTYPHTLLYES